MKRRIASLVILVVFIVACSTSTPTPTQTPVPSSTPSPTKTTEPTKTPEPTSTMEVVLRDYIPNIVRELNVYGRNLEAFSKLHQQSENDKTLRFDDTWKGEINLCLDGMVTSSVNMSKMMPPAGMGTFRNIWKEISSTTDDLRTNYKAYIENHDDASYEKITQNMKDINDLLDTAIKAVSKYMN